jgi:hypothetical protein
MPNRTRRSGSGSPSAGNRFYPGRRDQYFSRRDLEERTPMRQERNMDRFGESRRPSSSRGHDREYDLDFPREQNGRMAESYDNPREYRERFGYDDQEGDHGEGARYHHLHGSRYEDEREYGYALNRGHHPDDETRDDFHVDRSIFDEEEDRAFSGRNYSNRGGYAEEHENSPQNRAATRGARRSRAGFGRPREYRSRQY